MSAIRLTGSALPDPMTDAALPPDTWEGHTARSVAHWGRSGAVISVDGELDAANCRQFGDYVRHCADFCEWLVLDLHGLEFIGTAGFSVLEAINARCDNARVYWALVPSSAVSQLLRVCDPESVLPITESLATALATVQGRRETIRLVK